MAAPAARMTGFLSRVGQTFADLRNPTLRGSSHRTELLAGLTTFVTMAYIIFVNSVRRAPVERRLPA